ncbi:MAG: TetR/AcrR family transcriptional regulator [Thermomonospora sp. CIF 1]|nr:MAG: TetR/AcrR family transcriptional regulator [Thermomonospora sp. CIF 1]
MVEMKADPELEHITDVALRLFAVLGFDGTSTEMIAAAAGWDVDTFVARTGGRLKLYLTIMERIQRAEHEALRAAAASAAPGLPGLLQLADAYLDFHAAEPRFQWMWMHRWMGDAADTVELESYRESLTSLIADFVRPLVPEDVDVDYLLWTIVWSVAGFLTGGVVHSDVRARPARGFLDADRIEGVDPRELAAFRSFLHVFIKRMVAPA